MLVAIGITFTGHWIIGPILFLFSYVLYKTGIDAIKEKEEWEKLEPLKKGKYYFDVVGMKYKKSRRKNFKKLTKEDKLSLVPDPNNKYDKYAVEVHSLDGMIGYIPKTESKKLSKTLSIYPHVDVSINDLFSNGNYYRLEIEVFLGYTKEELAQIETIEQLYADSRKVDDQFKTKIDFAKAQKDFEKALEIVLEWINYVSDVNNQFASVPEYKLKQPLKELNIICNKLKIHELFIEKFNDVYDETLYTEKQNTDLLLRLEKSKQKTL